VVRELRYVCCGCEKDFLANGVRKVFGYLLKLLVITDYLEVPLRNCLLSRPSAFLRLIRAVFLPLDHVNTAGRSHAHIEMVRSECSNLLVKTLILDLPSAGIESTILILKVAT
jgi:hypothetical protein